MFGVSQAPRDSIRVLEDKSGGGKIQHRWMRGGKRVFGMEQTTAVHGGVTLGNLLARSGLGNRLRMFSAAA